MRKYVIYFLLILIVIVHSSCGPQLTVEGDVTESKLIIDEKRSFLTIYVRVQNTSNLPSGTLYAKFQILDNSLATALGFETFVFSNNQQIPEPFEIQPNRGFFIGETFEYNANLPLEQLERAVQVVIYNNAGENVTEFLIERVEKEE